MSNKDLNAAIAAAEKELSDLEAERDAMAADRQAVAMAADASEIVRITSRKKELPAYITAARLRLEQLLLERDRTELADLETESVKLKSAADAVHLEFEAIRDKRSSAINAFHNCRSKINSVESRANEREDRIAGFQRRLGAAV